MAIELTDSGEIVVNVTGDAATLALVPSAIIDSTARTAATNAQTAATTADGKATTAQTAANSASTAASAAQTTANSAAAAAAAAQEDADSATVIATGAQESADIANANAESRALFLAVTQAEYDTLVTNTTVNANTFYWNATDQRLYLGTVLIFGTPA